MSDRVLDIRVHIKDYGNDPNPIVPFVGCIDSLLASLLILTYMEKDVAIKILQYLTNRSRAYCFKQWKILNKFLLTSTIAPNLKSNQAQSTILQLYGRPSETLQMMQLVSQNSRRIAKNENGFQDVLTRPNHEEHL